MDVKNLLDNLRQISVEVEPMQRLREIYGTTDRKISRKRGRETTYAQTSSKKKGACMTSSEDTDVCMK